MSIVHPLLQFDFHKVVSQWCTLPFQLLKLVTKKVYGNKLICLINIDRMNPKMVNPLKSCVKRQNNVKARVHTDFAAALLSRLLGNNILGHTTRAPRVGAKDSEQATNCIQVHGNDNNGIANLGNTSYIDDSIKFFMELPAFF